MEQPELIGGVYPWRAHFAVAAGVKDINVLGSMLSEGKLPPLPPPLPMRAAGRIVWTQTDLENWTRYLDKWRADAPGRAAARKAEREARERYEMKKMMDEIETHHRLAESARKAQEQYEAERAAWVEATRIK